jgi:RNA polymerase sigma factor (sigma-70 family)
MLSTESAVNNDTGWLGQIAQGHQAETFLYQKYRERILYFAKRKLKSIEDAEDVCQNTWMAFIEKAHRGSVKETEKLSSYIYGICRNKVNDLRRQKYKSRHVSLDTIELTLFDPNADSSGKIIDAEAREKILQVFPELNLQERFVFYLRFFDGCKPEESSQITCIKPPTERKTAQLAKEKIIAKLAKAFQ